MVDNSGKSVTLPAVTSNSYAAPVTDTWFTATDNATAELESIMPVSETNYSVGKIDTTNAINQPLATTSTAFNYTKSNNK